MKNCLAWLKLSVICMVLMAFAPSCSGVLGLGNQAVKNVTPSEAFNLIEKNQDNPGFVIVDVRMPDEYAEGHIGNAVNIDYNSEGFQNEIGNLSRSGEYLIYCRAGSRSKSAVKVMEGLGFAKIYHLSTGILSWVDAGYQVVK
jgi:rhodanese-related sulfurtransferase